MAKRDIRVQNDDKPSCFAYKVIEDGRALCTALTDKKCGRCNFYRHRKEYQHSLEINGARNKLLGLDDKYPEFRLDAR